MLVASGSLAGPALAGKVKIGGTHSAHEIRATCASAGGEFHENGNEYGCDKTCGGSICEVNARAVSALVILLSGDTESFRHLATLMLLT